MLSRIVCFRVGVLFGWVNLVMYLSSLNSKVKIVEIDSLVEYFVELSGNKSKTRFINSDFYMKLALDTLN